MVVALFTFLWQSVYHLFRNKWKDSELNVRLFIVSLIQVSNIFNFNRLQIHRHLFWLKLRVEGLSMVAAVGSNFVVPFIKCFTMNIGVYIVNLSQYSVFNQCLLSFEKPWGREYSLLHYWMIIEFLLLYFLVFI